MTIKSLFSLIRLLLLISGTLGAKSPTTPVEVQSAVALARLELEHVTPGGRCGRQRHEIDLGLAGGASQVDGAFQHVAQDDNP